MAQVKGARGGLFYARILLSVWKEPGTSAEIARRVGSTRNTVARTMRRMYDLRLVRRKEWVRGDDGRNMAALWSFEQGPDAPLPMTVKTGLPNQRPGHIVERIKPSAEMVTFAAIIRALQDEPKSTYDLVDASGATWSTVRRLLRFSRSIGLAYVAEWGEQRIPGGSGAPVGMWALGIDKPDARRPKPMPMPVAHRRYREARKQREHAAEVTRALAGNSTPYREAVAA